jgi:hypothetical protein
MAKKAPDKIPAGPKLDELTAERFSAGKAFTSMKVRLSVRSRIRLVAGD